MKKNALREEYEGLKNYVFTTRDPEPSMLARYNNLFKHFHPHFRDSEYRDPTAQKQKMDLNSTCECLVDGARGSYIPQHFAKHHAHHFDNIDKADLSILLLGPTCDTCQDYQDAWDNILSTATFTDHLQRVWTLHEDQDLFMVLPEFFEENEQ